MNPRSLARQLLPPRAYATVSRRVSGPIRRVTDYERRLVGRLLGPVLAVPCTWMARTGEGTDQCLKRGSLPLPVHFYSPVPDLNDLERRDVWARRSELAGIEFAPESQVAYMGKLGD